MTTCSRGYTFGATEQVTNSKLHTLVDSATISSIVNADISSAAAIAESKINFDGSTVCKLGTTQTINGNKTFTGTLDFTGDGLTSLLEHIYPIGYVITLGVSTDPATLLGVGTWTQIKGKVIVGIDDSGTFDTLDATGGEETHTLTEAEMPAHTHTADGGTIGGGTTTLFEVSVNTAGRTATTDSTGGGVAHNNLQPYIVKYVWQRTA